MPRANKIPSNQKLPKKIPSNKKVKCDRRLTPQGYQDVRIYWPGSDREQRIKGRRTERRNPGRGDGISWNADSHICGAKIDDNFLDSGYNSEEVTEDMSFFGSEVDDSTSRLLPSISLTDMIRAAKPKRAKASRHAFVMVPTVSRVIVPDDCDSTSSYGGWEDDLEYSEEEWEQLQASTDSDSDSEPSQSDEGASTQKTYAQAVRVGGHGSESMTHSSGRLKDS